MPTAAELLERDPRIFWGHVIRVLVERGWTPPRPDERIVDDLIRAMSNVRAPRTRDTTPAGVPVDDGRLDLLTEREREVVELLVLGLTNAAIAVELDVAPQTIKFHLTNVYRKLEVGSRTSVVALVLGR